MMSVMTYNPSTGQIFGVCITSKRDYLDRLLQRLKRSKEFALNPFFTPVIATSICVHNARNECSKIADACKEIESTMGYWSEDEELSLDKVPNVARIPQRLNNLAIRIAAVDYDSSVLNNSLAQLENQLRHSPNNCVSSVALELQEQVMYLQQCTGDIKHVNKRLREGVQSMVQTVRILFDVFPISQIS
jgi:exonuclease VII large subunit